MRDHVGSGAAFISESRRSGWYVFALGFVHVVSPDPMDRKDMWVTLWPIRRLTLRHGSTSTLPWFTSRLSWLRTLPLLTGWISSVSVTPVHRGSDYYQSIMVWIRSYLLDHIVHIVHNWLVLLLLNYYYLHFIILLLFFYLKYYL